jgi:hypothetical protein
MIVVKSFLDKTFKQGDFEVTSKGQKMEKLCMLEFNYTNIRNRSY